MVLALADFSCNVWWVWGYLIQEVDFRYLKLDRYVMYFQNFLEWLSKPSGGLGPAFPPESPPVGVGFIIFSATCNGRVHRVDWSIHLAPRKATLMFFFSRKAPRSHPAASPEHRRLAPCNIQVHKMKVGGVSPPLSYISSSRFSAKQGWELTLLNYIMFAI